MKNYFFVLLLIVMTSQAGGQTKSPKAVRSKPKQNVPEKIIRKLKVGDQVPDLELGPVQNFSYQPKKLSAFRDKLLILDFWATWCGSCLGAIPSNEKIQKQFDGKLQIVMVNTEPREQVETFLTERAERMGFSLSLPRIQINPRMEKLFKFATIPHYVWINQKGYIIAITSSAELTKENIDVAIKGGTLNLKVKTDEQLPWDPYLPLFVAGNGGNGEQIKWHSVLSEYVEGLPGNSLITRTEKLGHTVFVTNLPIKDLYQLAYNDDSALALSSLGLKEFRTNSNIKDTSHFVGEINGKWVESNTYCYQLIAPGKSFLAVKKYMQEDLKHYFGLEAHLEKRSMDGYILSAMDSSVFKAKPGINVSREDELHGIIIKNNDISWLIRKLYDWIPPGPIVDETNFKGNIDLEIKADLTDFNAVVKELRRNGFDLRKERREVGVLVLNDPPEKRGD